MTTPSTPTTIERILYAAATLVVLSIAGGAVLLELTDSHDARPRILAQADGAPWDDGTARAVPWIVENLSSVDVERVQIQVRVGDREPVSQEVDYLPRGSSRRGVARLPFEPGEPTVEVAGYRLP